MCQGIVILHEDAEALFQSDTSPGTRLCLHSGLALLRDNGTWGFAPAFPLLSWKAGRELAGWCEQKMLKGCWDAVTLVPEGVRGPFRYQSGTKTVS